LQRFELASLGELTSAALPGNHELQTSHERLG
jgi:hypothetical protein